MFRLRVILFGMARPRSSEPACVLVGLNLTERQAAGIDAAIACSARWQGWNRQQWIRAMLDTQLRALAAKGRIEYGPPVSSSERFVPLVRELRRP